MLKSLFPGRFPRILSNWICHQTVFCNWLQTEKTHTKETNQCKRRSHGTFLIFNAITFSSSGMEKVKIFAPATFCFGKNRTILTTKIEYHRLMCNHFWKTLITICRLLIMRLILCQTLDWLFSLSSNFLWYSEFKIMCSPSAPYLAKNQPI